jgi:HEAT repeat protein
MKIGSLRTLEALRALQRLYTEEDDPFQRMYFTQAMGSIDGKEAARILVGYLTSEKNQTVRRSLRRTIRSLGAKDALEYLLKSGLKHRNPTVRQVTARALGDSKWPEAVQPLIQCLKDRDAETQLAVIEALAKLGLEEAFDPLLNLVSRGSGQEALAALWALGTSGSDDPRIVDAALGVLKGGKPVSLKVQAVNVLGSRRAASALGTLLPLLKDRDWRLRSAAIQALASIRLKDAIEPLIARLEREKGRLAVEVAEALHRITGIDIGFNVALWRDWWGKNKDTFEPPAEVRESKPAHKDKTQAYYHSIPVISKRIIFLLDVSSSMVTKLARTAVPSGPDGAPKGDTRLDYCKWELQRTIQRLAKDVRFNLITFETDVHTWQKTVVPTLPPNKAEACKFVEKQTPMGGTNLFDALKRAFEDPNADTLYVLSDGQPNDPTDDILNWVERTNGARMVVIHTISAGELASSDFLKRMAEMTGGNHVVLK